MASRDSCLLNNKVCKYCKDFYKDCRKNGMNEDDDACPNFNPTKMFFYDDENHFVPAKLADWISLALDGEKFITFPDTEEMFYWEGRGWRKEAKPRIKSIIRNFLMDSTSIHRLRETIENIKINTFEKREEISLPKKYVPLKNGLFNLETGDLEGHDSSFFYLHPFNIEFDKKAKCDKFLKFLSEVVDEKDVPLIQEIFGYLLIRSYPFQKAFCFIGEGANGKSTLINVLRDILGKENISSVSLHDIATRTFSSGRLYQRYANLFPDLEQKALNDTSLFKILTGGDIIDAEIKYGGTFRYTNFAKLIFSANRLPPVNHDDSMAFYRRWIMIIFPNQFTGENENPFLLDELTRKEEMAGIFNWMYEGYKRLMSTHKFSNSHSVAEIQEIYDRLSNPIKSFLMDIIAPDDLEEEVLADMREYKYMYSVTGIVPKDDFYKDYVKYCIKQNLPAKANNVFARELLASTPKIEGGLASPWGERIRVWKGIKVIQKTEDRVREEENKSRGLGTLEV